MKTRLVAAVLTKLLNRRVRPLDHTRLIRSVTEMRFRNSVSKEGFMDFTRSCRGLLLAIVVLFTASNLHAAGAIVFVKTGNVWIMNTDGTGQRALTTQGGASQPRIANGVVVFLRNGQLFKTDSTGSTPSSIPNTTSVREFALHPAGTRIAVAYESNFVLHTLNINGSGRTAINSTSNLHQIYPYWGRDGFIYLGQAPLGNPFAQSVYRIPENGVNNPASLVNYFSQQPAEGGTQGKVAFLYNQPAPRLRLINRDGTGQSDVPNSPSGINETAFDYDSNTIYYSISEQIRRISTTGAGDTLLASGTNGDFGYGTVAAAAAANGVCYIDVACSGGSQYSVRDSGSGRCVAVTSCNQLWKCAAGPTTGTCGGGSVDCTFSPGCQSAAQTCFDGFCTSISSCNDRIKFQGYSFNPGLNECDCQGNPPAAGPTCNTQTTFRMSVGTSGLGSGRVTSSPSGITCGGVCSASFASGTTLTLTATPSAGSTFSGWSGACNGTGPCSVSMTSDRSVSANFALLPQASCTQDATTLCLSNNRFRVNVQWTDFEQRSGAGRVVPYFTSDSGMFWFFDSRNWEMMVKVLNACSPPFSKYWVFSAATTNVQYNLTVTDTLSGRVRQYSNPLGTSAAAITDTNAFDTCP